MTDHPSSSDDYLLRRTADDDFLFESVACCTDNLLRGSSWRVIPHLFNQLEVEKCGDEPHDGCVVSVCDELRLFFIMTQVGEGSMSEE